MVAVDCTDTEAGHRHQRLDPLTKTVVVHVRENIEDLTASYMPGYIFKIPGNEVYFSKNLRWGPDSTWDERAEQSRDTRDWRDVNFNKAGAGRWYVGYALPCSYPIPDTSKANAVTFWRWEGSGDLPGAGTYGGTYGRIVWLDAISQSWSYVPRNTRRCVVAQSRIMSRAGLPYYQAHPDSFLVDVQHMFAKTIAHEFGHAVGMFHPDTTSVSATFKIMDSVRFISTGPDSGRFYRADSLFSTQSLEEFSTKGELP